MSNFSLMRLSKLFVKWATNIVILQPAKFCLPNLSKQ